MGNGSLTDLFLAISDTQYTDGRDLVLLPRETRLSSATSPYSVRSTNASNSGEHVGFMRYACR